MLETKYETKHLDRSDYGTMRDVFCHVNEQVSHVVGSLTIQFLDDLINIESCINNYAPLIGFAPQSW